MREVELRALLERDTWCWHCGATDDLVPHHRANRGMGGHKASDILSNVIMVCSVYNGLMESDSKVAEQARIDGHKLSKYLDPRFEPVFDYYTRLWYYLDNQGNKIVKG